MAKKYTHVNRLVPTQLIPPHERPAVPPARIPSRRFRYFYVAYQLLRLWLGNLRPGLKGRKSETKRRERTIKYLQRLGMLWIRVAQILSLRGTDLSTAFGKQLLDLRDKGGAHCFSGIREIVEKELERPLEEVFDHFEKTPFAATTVSQLHRARLRKEQVWTAVKVQQPYAEDIFNRDLRLFRRIIGVMKLLSIMPGMRWDELYHELKEIKVRELNYYYEAAALEMLDKNLKNQPVHAPQLFRSYCRKRMLVMEFIQGALLSDYIAMRNRDPERLDAWLKENNIQPEKMARRLFYSMYRQVFENNFFHGDMNTGNIILLRDNNIAVIECRSAGSLEVESLEKQKMFLKSLAEGEYVTAAEIYFLLATRLPRVDLNTVKEKLIRIWRVWETRTHIDGLLYEEKSLAYMTGLVNRVVFDSQFAPLWSFTKLTSTWVHLDNTIGVLYPDLNYLKCLRRYFKRSEQRETMAKVRRLPSRLATAISALHELPRRTAEYTLFKETLMRRQAQVVQGSASKLHAFIATGFGFLSFLTFMTGGFLALVFGIRFLNFDVERLLGPQLVELGQKIPNLSLSAWLLILVILMFALGFFRTQKKRFSSKEFGHTENGNVMET
ncbi:MAG: AarF/ABC1/UbiB kinase family protein [bacterium]|nr:AarF/ABC1/UbiB kinase family protein [bacterium]